jgi:hypothetical protein
VWKFIKENLKDISAKREGRERVCYKKGKASLAEMLRSFLFIFKHLRFGDVVLGCDVVWTRR